MPTPTPDSRYKPPVMSPLLLLGGGGHALVVVEAARSLGLSLAGCLDDADSPVLSTGPIPVPRLGPLHSFADFAPQNRLILTFGDVATRKAWLAHALLPEANFITICHPSSCVSITACISSGVFVGPLAIVNAQAAIGNHAIINSGAIVEHECDLAENVHIAPGAVLGGRVTVGSNTLIGIGARVNPGIKIGSGVVVGAGAVVIANVPDGQRVVGCPAKPI